MNKAEPTLYRICQEKGGTLPHYKWVSEDGTEGSGTTRQCCKAGA